MHFVVGSRMRPHSSVLKAFSTVTSVRKSGHGQRHLEHLIKAHKGGFDLGCGVRTEFHFRSQSQLQHAFPYGLDLSKERDRVVSEWGHWRNKGTAETEIRSVWMV